MYKSLLFLVLMVLFTGCAAIAPLSQEQEPVATQKVFEEEDSLIFFALRAEQLKENNASAEIFHTLYLKSDKKEYLYRSIQNDLAISNNENAIKKIDDVIKGSYEDFILVRLKIIALIQMQRFEEAKNISQILVEKSKFMDDYILLSDIYVKLEKFDMAIKYLEGAYAQNYNEKVLDRMSIVLYINLQRKKDAIAQLETHARVHGCSELICKRLLAFYSNENNIEGLLSTYLRLYKITPNDEVAKKIVQIYAYKKEYIKMMGFLEKSNSDDVTLLQLYLNAKDYSKAFVLADKIYAKTAEIEFLGQSAIYEYESAKNKSEPALLKRVTKKFAKVVAQSKDPLYLNYYGFILIDHDIDAAAGIVYVKMALEVEPNSIYYLDSLAWGYYKLGECQEADVVMQKILKEEGSAEPEVLLHAQEIKKCLQIKQEVKK